MKRTVINSLRHIVSSIVLILLGLWSVQALFHSGLFTAHDIWHNVARFYWYTHALSQGEWLPAWIAPLAGGYGYPLFIFSYPLPWLIGFPFVALGLSLEVALKVLYGASFVASGLLMYGFAYRVFTSRLAAFVAGALFMIAPYHFLTIFVSAATGIALAYMFIPVLFWGIWEIGQEKNSRGVALLSLGLMGIITSHLILAVMLSLFALVWLLFVVLQAKRKQHVLKHLLFGSLLGLGLAAFYLVPFASYSKLIRANDPGAGFAKLYETNFASLEQLLYSPWGFGPIISNAKDGEISLQVGVAQWLAFFVMTMILGAAMLKIEIKRHFTVVYAKINQLDQARRNKYANGQVIYLLFALSVFSIWELSKPLWDVAAKVMPLDYPFRLLVVAVLFGSLLAGKLVALSHYRFMRLIIALSLVSIALYTNRNHTRVNLYTSIPIADYVQAEKTTNTMDEYLPTAADRSLTNKPYQFIEPKHQISKTLQMLNLTSFQVEASQSGSIRLGQWAFPGQRVTLDGNEIQSLVASDGRIELELPAGAHDITISYEKTIPFTIGYVISTASFIILFCLPIMHVKRKKRS